MSSIRSGILAVVLSLMVSGFPTISQACGGFFCTTIPINQAAEQIVFRQENNVVTAMVRILYEGNAEDFSWVVPVPDTPDISLGADTTFTELSAITQPQFQLQVDGQVCPQDEMAVPTTGDQAEAGAEDESDGVVIEEEQSVGPFEIVIVSSDNPDDMSIWLQDNGYLLNDRGVELLEPYVLAGMKFVALKLRSGESSGSIQPLIMRYPSEKPEVPIRLTAIAAEEDMGVLVWVVNNARAIPENYEHVTPNYTRLDWFSGALNASYVSYQALVSEAMNETASGQGFATDYAGSFSQEMRSSLTDAAVVQSNLAELDGIANDADFLTNSLFLTTDSDGALAILQSALPLPEGAANPDTYFDSELLASTFTSVELAQARTDVRALIVERELEPITNGVALLPADSYMTRLYTTLSADEMTLDPTFNYNDDMPDQPLLRQAQIVASCNNDISRWNLTLGSGTGREGETVLEVEGQPIPFSGSIAPVDTQPAAFLRERTSAEAMPELLAQADVSLVQLDADNMVVDGFGDIAASSDDDGFLGAAGYVWLLIASVGIAMRGLRV